jgi:hypothetical protein
MPNDSDARFIGFIPEVSMGCSVGHPILNLALPDPQSDIGVVPQVREFPWGTYLAEPPEFVGAFPLNHDLVQLPENSGSQNNQVHPYEEPIVVTEEDLERVRSENLTLRFDTPPVNEGQVLVSNGVGNQWGPAPDPDYLYTDPNGGTLFINQAPSLTEGDIQFRMQNGSEVIRIEANGDFYIHGRKVDNDHEIYQHFRKFLGMSFSLPVADPRPRDGIETRYERILKRATEDQ